MSAFREPGFKERQEAAAKAKQAALDKLRARQKPVNPAVVQQEADRGSRAKKPTAEKPTAKKPTAAKKSTAAKKPNAAKDTRATGKAAKQAAAEAAPKAARKARKT